jgi:hypothetical protein
MNKLMSGGFFIDLNEKNELFYSDFNCDDEPDELSQNDDIQFDEPYSDDGSIQEDLTQNE